MYPFSPVGAKGVVEIQNDRNAIWTGSNALRHLDNLPQVGFLILAGFGLIGQQPYGNPERMLPYPCQLPDSGA